MADVFLSYADLDLKAIQPLVRAIEQEGWTVFWDRDIPLGKTWRQVLDEELSVARCVVVVWTKASVDRRWVIEEAEEGQSRGILIPVFMDPVDPPRGFREVQGAKLFGWKGKTEHEEFQRLVEACRHVIGEPGQPPPELPMPTPPPARSGSRLKWMAAVLALLLVGAGSWFWYQARTSQSESSEEAVDESPVPPDPLVAAVRYKEGCDRGKPQDCNRLADLYASGRGVGEDPLRAAGLYHQACEGGITAACMSLAALYEAGRGVAKDEERAAGLYEQVCNEGLEAGCTRLEELSKLRLERGSEAAPTSAEAKDSERPATKSEALAERRAELRVTVLPWGDVWINGKYGRRAPFEVALKPGKYTISVGQGTPSKRREVRLKPGEERTEHFDLSK